MSSDMVYYGPPCVQYVRYIAESGASVFNSSTQGWARVVGSDPIVDRITRNVIDKLHTHVMSNQEIILRLHSAIAKTSEWTELVNELNILINDLQQ